MKTLLISLLLIASSWTFGYSHTELSVFNERYDSYDILNQSQAIILSGNSFSLTQKFFIGQKWKKGLFFKYKYLDLLPEAHGIPIFHDKKSFLNGGFYLTVELNQLNELEFSTGSVEKLFFSHNSNSSGIKSIYQSLFYQTMSYTKYIKQKRVRFGFGINYIFPKQSTPAIEAGYGGNIYAIFKVNKFDLKAAFSYESQNTDYEKQKVSSASLSIGYGL